VRATVLLLLGFAAGLTAGCAAAPDHADIARRADAVLDPLFSNGDFSGAVVLSRHGRVVYERAGGWANRAEAVRYGVETSGDGASLAKTLTAASLYGLAGSGALSLDDPVTRHLPDFPHAGTTLRHLLSHSAGLPDYEALDPHLPTDGPKTTEGMLRVIAARGIAPSFVPGTRFEYSSLGYDVAALAIARHVGEPFSSWLEKRFLAPLGMHDTFVRPASLSEWPGVRTLGYRRRGADWAVFDVFDREGFAGGSNVYFSTRDLGRWADAFAQSRVLPPSLLEAGLAPARLDDGEPLGIVGLGWYCDRLFRCHYSGDLRGFYSLVHWDRARRESVVYMSNSTLPAWHRAALAGALVDALTGAAHRSRPPVEPVALARGDLGRIAGVYPVPGVGTVAIEAREAGVFLRIGSGPTYRAHQVDRTTFTVPGLDLWLAFSGRPEPDTLHVRHVGFDAAARRTTAFTIPGDKP
jgi:CubicO group peptidase (beta-lactamase class C family)